MNTNEHKLTLLSGDGVGYEIFSVLMKTIDWFNEKRDTNIVITESLIGDAATDSYGDALSEKTIAACYKADSVMIGPLSDPNKKLVRQLIAEMNCTYGMVTGNVIPELSNFSPIKDIVSKHINLVVVTDITEGHATKKKDKTKPDAPTLISTEILSQEKALHDSIDRCFQAALGRERQLHVVMSHRGSDYEKMVMDALKTHQKTKDDYKKLDINPLSTDRLMQQILYRPTDYDVLMVGAPEFDVLSSFLLTLLPAHMGFEIYGGHDVRTDQNRSLYVMQEKDSRESAGSDSANPFGVWLMLEHFFRLEMNKRAEADLLRLCMRSLLDRMIRPANLMPRGSTHKIHRTSDIGVMFLEELEKQVALYKNVS